MNSMNKFVLFFAGLLSLAGIILMCISGYGAYKYIKSGFKTEEGTFEIDESNYKLDISMNAGEIEILTGDTSYIEYKISSFTSIKFDANKLTINNDGFFSWLPNKNNSVKIYLKNSQDIDLNVELNAGLIKTTNIEFNSLNLVVNAGEIRTKDVITTEDFIAQINAGKLDYSGHSKNIEFNINVGYATLNIDEEKSNYVIKCDVNVGSGDEKYDNGGEKKITGSVDVGSINLKFA